MVDICLCMNKDKCPLKDTCYRALAESDTWYQSFANFYIEDKVCPYYWKCNTKEELECLNNINR